MKKLEEINRLVEEAMKTIFKDSLYSPSAKISDESVRPILTTLARKCAEINVSDLVTECCSIIEIYNSRLRDGQVEEVKQEERTILKNTSVPQPLKAGDSRVLVNGFPVKVDFRIVAEDYYQEHFQKNALQPLPEEIPEWFIVLWKNSYSHEPKRIEEWNKIRQHFGTQPREWWRDLKKGDKFVYKKDVCTFDGRVAIGDVDYRTFNLEDCSPYTDPAQSFRSKLTPEMQVEFDKVVSSLTPNTPQP